MGTGMGGNALDAAGTARRFAVAAAARGGMSAGCLRRRKDPVAAMHDAVAEGVCGPWGQHEAGGTGGGSGCGQAVAAASCSRVDPARSALSASPAGCFIPRDFPHANFPVSSCISPASPRVPPRYNRFQVRPRFKPATHRRAAGVERCSRVGKMLRFLHPYRREIGLAVGLLLLQSLAELFLPALMAIIVDEGVVNGDAGRILEVGAVMLLVAAAGTGAAVAATYFASRTANGFGRDVRREVFRRVSSFSQQEMSQLGTATLITRTTNDVTQVQQVVYLVLRMLVSAPLLAVGGVVMAIATDPQLAWVIAAVVPLLVLAIVAVASRALPMFRALQEKIDRLNRVVRELLVGVRVVRAFNRTDYEHRRFTLANQDLTETAIRVNRLMGASMPIMMILLNMAIVAVMWFGAGRVESGHTQIGDLMAFIQYVYLIMFSLLMVSMVLIILPRAAVSAGRISEVLETEPRIQDPPVARPVAERRGVVEFRNVTFQYPGAEAPALQGISFRAEPGKTTAIIGGTGSGKSTLVNLLVRFYDATEGQVLVDGVDVREQPQDELRRCIGFVPQKAVLFSGTIRDNIRYGCEDATEDEIERAAGIAQALEFIRSMPQGFDTMVDQGGTNLSGGQRQRLTIARAVVRRPKVYVFDDCFSALDFKTDAAVRAALKRETHDATVIIVAQRVNTIMHADQIIVLDSGRAVGIGTHEELVRTCPVYREIVISQLGEEAVA